MTFSPEAQAQMDAGRAQRRDRWDGRVPAVEPEDGEADIGQTVWEKQVGGANHPVRGGIIVQIIDDDVTGLTRVVCVNPHENPNRGKRWDADRAVLYLDDINPDDRRRLSAAQCATIARRLFSCIGIHGVKAGFFSHADEEILSFAVTMMKLSKGAA